MSALRARWLTIVLWTAFALILGWAVCRYSMHLAATRIYQVDECQNVCVAKILADGQAEHYFTRVSLIHVPLMWLARNATQSVELFANARCFSLLLFWLNLILIAVGAGGKLLSRRGLVALVGACTLAPLWDYGFEVRHDNLLLAGLLITWCAIRAENAGVHSYAVAGAMAVVMQFTAFKSFLYTLPMAMAFLLFPPFGDRVARWKLVLAWLGGALGMFVVIRLAYGAAGIWGTYVTSFQWASGVAGRGGRFAPWDTLGRLLTQTPLLLALVVAGLFVLIADLLRRGRAVSVWGGCLPEAVMFLVTLGALLINPTPYPYNLVTVVPFAFLFAFRYLGQKWDELGAQSTFLPLSACLLVFTHLIPFVIATRRHLDWPNFRQESVMRLAERVTDPEKDPVYDGIGMVPTRRSIDFDWFLHSLNIERFHDGSGPRVRDLLAKNPAAVIIPSYRTDWLPEPDHAFIRSNYVAVSDDFWVLGHVLPAGGGQFEIIHGGRYRISTLQGSDLAGTYPVGMAGALSPEDPGVLAFELDGIQRTNGPVELAPGIHRLKTAAGSQAAIVWVGPRLDRLRRQGAGDHQRLFCNWY